MTRRLGGQFTQIYHLNEEHKVIAFHRWDKGGKGDDVVVVANFLHLPQENYTIGFPSEGFWQMRFNSDACSYSQDFADFKSSDVSAESGAYDGLPWHASISIAPYSVLIFSQSLSTYENP